MRATERHLPDRHERGQVGIGTLIVFIAMVLVAAIAAGVLINTAGFLQSKGQATGEESTAQVVNRLEVISITGTVDSSDTIDTVDVTVTQAPGSDNIDLENLTVQWVGPSGSYNLVHTDASASADGSFTVSTFKDSDNSSPVVNDPDDRLVLAFDLTTLPAAKLDDGETVRLKMAVQSGATTSTTLLVPESLAGEEAVVL
jgi:flagellin-like protein